jgi:hypothetical protein
VHALSRLLRCRVEFLTHDISVHVPHHVASKIPWYNLRKANASLRQNWGQVGLLHSYSLLGCIALYFSPAGVTHVVAQPSGSVADSECRCVNVVQSVVFGEVSTRDV